MPVSIVSNLASRYAMSAIRTRTEASSVASQRLSTGQRVFSADQDAAAMAVGSGLKIENAALAKAKINAAAGGSMLQVADGALGQMSDILTRMQVLATQASSGHIDASARAVIGQEFSALSNEVDRLARVTNFNGVAMLAGSPEFTLQGAHDYTSDGVENLTFNGNISADAAFRYSYDSTTESMTMTRIDGATSVSQTIDMTALLDTEAGAGQQLGAYDHVALNFNSLGVTLTVGNGFDRTADLLPALTDSTGTDIGITTQTFTPTSVNVGLEAALGLQALGGAYSHVSGALTMDVNSNGTAVTLAGITGISYAVNGGAVGASGAATGDLVGAGVTVDVYVDQPSGGKALLGRMSLGTVSTTVTPSSGQIVVTAGQGIIGADYIGDEGDTPLVYAVGTGVSVGDDLLTVTIPAMTASAQGLTGLSVSSQLNADAAITAIQLALGNLNLARAQIGAQQSRLDRVANNISLSMENNETARSALLDTDVSAEITNLTNQQTMLQVGVSMLSQANRIPDMLLQLIKN